MMNNALKIIKVLHELILPCNILLSTVYRSDQPGSVTNGAGRPMPQEREKGKGGRVGKWA